MNIKKPWLLLLLAESIYIIFSTFFSVIFSNDPMKGEVCKTIIRIISLLLYIVFFNKIIVSKDLNKRISVKTKILILISSSIIMLYPLLFQKAGFTNLLQLIWILSSFIVGFREEIFYRAFIQNKISSKCDIIQAILITSIIFTLYHVVYFIWGQWFTIIQIFMWSIFIGIIYFKTKNIILVSIIHGIYDAIPFITPFKINNVPYLYGLLFILISVVVITPIIFIKGKNLTTAST